MSRSCLHHNEYSHLSVHIHPKRHCRFDGHREQWWWSEGITYCTFKIGDNAVPTKLYEGLITGMERCIPLISKSLIQVPNNHFDDPVA